MVAERMFAERICLPIEVTCDNTHYVNFIGTNVYQPIPIPYQEQLFWEI